MNSFRNLLMAGLCALAIQSCSSNDCATLTEALDSSAWEVSQWISAADAPVVEGTIDDGNCRAADGASWFVSPVVTGK